MSSNEYIDRLFDDAEKNLKRKNLKGGGAVQDTAICDMKKEEDEILGILYDADGNEVITVKESNIERITERLDNSQIELYDENNNRVFVENGKLEVQIGDRWPRYAEPSDSEQSGIRWWKDDE